jgi:hypothetical protein
MNTHISAAQLDQLRRDAKRLGRTLSIPHSEALDRIAAKQGFNNWSLLSRHSAASPSVTSLSPPSPDRVQPPDDPRRRYYLHGDQYEEDPSRYYCAQCDVFFQADHIESHGQHTYERYMSAEERWAKRDASMKLNRRRPDNPVNILREPALAARAQYKVLRPAFSDWLLAQGRLLRTEERRDGISIMAVTMLTARGLPTRPRSLTELLQHYRSWGKHSTDLAALEEAWAEFLALQPDA